MASGKVRYKVRYQIRYKIRSWSDVGTTSMRPLSACEWCVTLLCKTYGRKMLAAKMSANFPSKYFQKLGRKICSQNWPDNVRKFVSANCWPILHECILQNLARKCVGKFGRKMLAGSGGYFLATFSRWLFCMLAIALSFTLPTTTTHQDEGFATLLSPVESRHNCKAQSCSISDHLHCSF